MNCFYCQQALQEYVKGSKISNFQSYSIELCNNHPCLVYQYFNSIQKLVFIVFVTNALYKDSNIYVQINFQTNSIWIYYFIYEFENNKNISKLPITLYQGEMPNNFSPENVIDFVIRISKLQAFT